MPNDNPNDTHTHAGAASSAPENKSMASSSSQRPLRLTRRNFHRVFGGPACNIPGRRVRVAETNPLCTLGESSAHGSSLEGSLFAKWSRHQRCGLQFAALQGLEDEAWDIWRACQVKRGEKRVHSSMVRLCEGAYQIPRMIYSDRSFVRDPLAAEFVALVDSYLRLPTVDGVMNPIRRDLFRWGCRLPDYSTEGSASCTRSREWDSFEWVMLSEGGFVITREDWEVVKGIHARTSFEQMSVRELLRDGFHVSVQEVFPSTPDFLRGLASIPAGMAMPPLWSLRFFAAYILGSGAPDGSWAPSASTRQRLMEIVRDEVVICIVLGVVAERDAFKRTPSLPVNVINRVLNYDGPDNVPTRRGDISVKAVGARLFKVRTVSPHHLVVEHPLHVTEPLFYAPDELLDGDEFDDAVMAPVVGDAQPSSAPLSPDGVEPEFVSSNTVQSTLAHANHAPQMVCRGVTEPQTQVVHDPAPPVPAMFAPRSGSDGACAVPGDAGPSRHADSPAISASPLSELFASRVEMSEFTGAFPYMQVALAPLVCKGTVTLRELTECVSGWVRRVDPHCSKKNRRGSRGGTILDLRKTRAALSASQEENCRLRHEVGAMSEQLSRLSAQVRDQAGTTTRKRQRTVYGDAARSQYERRDGEIYEGRAQRFRRGRSPREEWDVCCEPHPWRRERRDGDGGAGFAA